MISCLPIKLLRSLIPKFCTLLKFLDLYSPYMVVNGILVETIQNFWVTLINIPYSSVLTINKGFFVFFFFLLSWKNVCLFMLLKYIFYLMILSTYFLHFPKFSSINIFFSSNISSYIPLTCTIIFLNISSSLPSQCQTISSLKPRTLQGRRGHWDFA